MQGDAQTFEHVNICPLTCHGGHHQSFMFNFVFCLAPLLVRLFFVALHRPVSLSNLLLTMTGPRWLIPDIKYRVPGPDSLVSGLRLQHLASNLKALVVGQFFWCSMLNCH